MSKALKVYGTTRTIRKQIYRIIVATNTLKNAITLLGTTSAYISVTGNKEELEIALSDPGVVYYCLEQYGVNPVYVTREELK